MGEYKYVRKTMRYNGKKYEATGKTEREAYLKLSEKITAAKRGEEIIGGGMTVDAWFDEWMRTYKEPRGIQESTKETIRGTYRKWISPAVGKMSLKDVRDVHLQKALNAMDGMSKGYIKKVMEIIKGMFLQARRSRLIPYDPSECLVQPKGREGHRRSLTDAEQEAVMDVARTHRRGLWVMTLLLTGMRPGETASLTWNNVDFARNEIHVITAREVRANTVKAPKSEAGIRDIPIHAQLAPLLAAAKGDPFSLVFPNKRGKIASTQSMLLWWSSFTAAVEKAHPGVLGDGLTAYCLRHTFCTNLQKAGVPINVAKDLMGHSDIGMTANIYTHRDAEVLHQGIALLDGTGVRPDTGGKSGGK